MVKFDRDNIENSWERKRAQLLIKASGRVERVYARAATSMAGYFNQIKPTDAIEKVWSKNKNIEKKIDKILLNFNKELEQELTRTFKDGWHLANDKHDEIAADYLKGIAIGSELKRGMFDRNMKAMDVFLKEGLAGESISGRVWNLNRQYKDQLKFFAASGIGTGRDSRKIARDLKKYLKNPDKRFRRVRDPKTGKLKTSAPAKDYHPGGGVYRSSYKNAWRYAAGQTNRAYRFADHHRIQNEPWVTGIHIHLSGAHPRYDICDELVGKYPKGYKFGGFHPWCICYQTTINLSPKEFGKYMRTKQIAQSKYVQNIPGNAQNYLNKNLKTFKNWKNPPLFMRENFNLSGSKIANKAGMVPKGSKDLGKVLNKAENPEIRPLIEDEKKAIKGYQRGTDINSFLRLNKKYPAENILGYKKMETNLSSSIRHSVKHEGTVYRGIQFETSEDYYQFLDKIRRQGEGGYYTDKGFVSTTLDKNVVREEFIDNSRSAFIEIKAKGKNGMNVNKVLGKDSIFSEEKEILFDKNSTFIIKEIESELGIYLKLEEL